MRRAPIFTAALLIALSAARALAADPLLGRWLLVSQEIDGRKMEISEMTLRIEAAGQAIEFAYSVPVNNIQFVSLRFTARPDGTDADVTNGNGQKVGTAKVTKTSASQYRVIVQGPNKPTATATAIVSPDGKTLTWQSESKAEQGAMTRMTQVFSRQ
jgi:hypothetical protein